MAMEDLIRRYFKFASFVDFISRRRFFFPSLQKLRSDDPFEGSVTVGNYIHQTGMAPALETIIETLADAFRPHGTASSAKALPPWPPCRTVFGEIPVDGGITYNDAMELQRKWIDVLCWHKGADESIAMWKIYSGAEPSVCVVSTPELLRSSLRLGPDLVLRLEDVRYRDYDAEFWTVEDPLEFALTKRKAYAYEQEFRAIVFNPDTKPIDKQSVERTGRYVDVAVEGLVSEIRVSPKADDWFLDLIKHLVPETLRTKVHRSEIDKDPIV